MKNRGATVVLIFVILLSAAVTLLAQSGPEFRRSAVMRGNLVKTVFGNWGVIGQPAEKGTRGAWVYDNNGYIGDVSPLVGAEVTVGDKTFHSMVIAPANRPTRQQELSPSGSVWGFEPKAGFFNEAQEGVALYSDPDSWPTFWADKMDDPEDPGWSGSWNGFFGKTTTASEEAYFVMDDNNDEEFNYADFNQWNVEFKPDANDLTRNGLGFDVKVRAMQWSDFLAQDCIFWLYEITNNSTTDYSKVVFGMLVGTYIGVTSTEDFREYDDDYSFFDVEKDLTFTGDFDDNARRNPHWTGDVGVVGYAFLESPGNQFDGIDNDGDADSNMLIPGTGPYFTEEEFAPRTINAGDQVVLIDNNYNRSIVVVPPYDTTFVTRGGSVFISPGVTKLAEGNVILIDGRDAINPNVNDGIDNDLDGLIDENFYLHYRQIRKDQFGNVLINILSPVRHVDYISGLGIGDLMIDERRDDGIDNDGDWNEEFDDVGADGLIGTNDFGEGDGAPTAGEPNFDGTDVDESDQIGLTSFEYFTPANDFAMADDEDLWDRLEPGNFEVPESIVNNKPERGEDGDFFYGSGYFPLRAGETQRFSLALVYGEGGGPNVEIEDLLNNRETVQKIYDSDYRFPPAPDKPTLSVVPGDGEVTLYWDRKAESSFDPVLKEYDFEGYKIYKATDHNFNDIFSITDADGVPISYEPLAQFDADNGISGYFRAGPELYQQSHGASFYLGDDSGLQHSFVDTDVENGKRYFYAVVAYDRGDSESDIFPKENDKRIDLNPTGLVRTFQNTAVAIPNAEVAGYEPPEGSVLLEPTMSIGTGNAYSIVVDESAQTGHEYRLSFLDTSNDGIDNDGDWDVLIHDVGSDGIAGTEDADGSEENGLPDSGEPNVDDNDPDEYFVPITTSYSVQDLTGVSEFFQSQDTLWVKLSHKNLVEGSVELQDAGGNTVPAAKYRVDLMNGKIRGEDLGDFLHGNTFKITYSYFPVYKSPNIERSPYAEETLDTDIFDGLQLSFDNKWTVVLDTGRTYWSDPAKAYDINFVVIDTYLGSNRFLGTKHPADYTIIFADGIVDTSLASTELFVTAKPVNFRIYNVTDQRYIDFIFADPDRNGVLSSFDELVFAEYGENDTLLYTWDLFFTQQENIIYNYGAGDSLLIRVKKPFRSGDFFLFTSEQASVNETAASDQLDRIKVVPNPYIVATTHELPLAPAITSGRGDRKIDFIHLPAGATIHIFTSRGERVRVLEHEKGIHDGTVSWNLKTDENLDIAPGIYFYILESSVGQKTGKIAIIK